MQTWGRDEALGTMFTLLMDAVGTDADDRTEDQENAVAWLTAATQRRAVRAAEAAGREYVKWAGLDEIEYVSLLDRNPTQGQLEEFLNDPPQNWVPPHLTTGYCALSIARAVRFGVHGLQPSDVLRPVPQLVRLARRHRASTSS